MTMKLVKRLYNRGQKILDRLKKNSNITALTLEKLCLILDCQPNDVITFVQK